VGAMAILVTGGAGYIGNVVDYLLSRGEKVVVLDNLARGHRRALDAEVPFYRGDVGSGGTGDRSSSIWGAVADTRFWK
jgi:UDP-glucose 4-epimerase